MQFNVVAFGECFINTNYSNEEYRKEYNVGDFFTIVEPEDVIHIYRFGVPLGYLYRPQSKDKTIVDNDKLLPERSYIHIIPSHAVKTE